MAEFTEEQLHDMSDEQLEAAMKEAKAELGEHEAEEAMLDELPNESADEEVEVEVMEEPDETGEPIEEPVEESNDDEAEIVETEEASTEDKPDDTESDTGNETEDETETEDEIAVQTFKPLKVDGKEININSLDELYSLASAGGQFTKKMQEIAPYRKAVAAMAENGLSDKDISLLIEATKGDKDALASIIEKSGIDMLEVSDKPADGYKPGAYLPTDSAMNLKEVQQEIMNDPEYNITEDIVNRQMDPASQAMLVENPTMIKGIHQDVRSGVYPAVSAEAQKLKMMDGGRQSDMDYYIQAAKAGSYQAPEAQMQPATPVQETRQPTSPALNAQRKAASSTRARKTAAPKVVDYLDMSDDDIAKERDRIMSNY